MVFIVLDGKCELIGSACEWVVFYRDYLEVDLAPVSDGHEGRL